MAVEDAPRVNTPMNILNFKNGLQANVEFEITYIAPWWLPTELGEILVSLV